MLKFFFWILLLANAGLLAYQQGYFATLLPSGHEPARMSNQLNADKVRLVPPPAPAPAPAAVKQEEVVACAEIGNFNPEEAKRFTAQLVALSLGERLSQRPVQEVASHMVYIPPLADKDAAEKKAGELRRMGINEFYIIQDNSDLRWSISLGVFKLEEAARAHLTNLSQKGVRSARIGQRSVASNAVVFQVRELDTTAKSALQKISADFPKQELRNCEPA